MRLGTSHVLTSIFPAQLTAQFSIPSGPLGNLPRTLPSWALAPQQTYYLHSPHNINIATQSGNPARYVVQLLQLNVGRPGALVLHTGARGSLSTVVSRLNSIRVPISQLPVNLLIEPPAGDGTKLCGDWPELRRLFENLDRSNAIGICLDTQHLFGSGMCNFADANTVDQLLDYTSHIARVQMIHLNDSAVQFNAKVDSHQTLGLGYNFAYHPAALLRLLEYCNGGLDMVTETGSFEQDLHFCHSLVMQYLEKQRDVAT